MLSKKLLRDFKENRKQFIAIFLMSFITLLAFSGIGAEVQGLQNNLNNYYNQTNMADAYVLGVDFNDSLMQDFKDLNSTKEIERQLVMKSTASLKDDPIVTLHFLESNNISKYYPIKGDKIDFNDADGIWLGARFAEAKNLKIGDTISFEFNGMKLNKTIRGVGYSPDYVYEEPDNGMITDFNYQGFGYLSYKAYPSPDMHYNKLLMKSNENATKYYNQTHQMLKDKGHQDILDHSSYVPRADSASHKQIQNEINQHVVLAVMFPIIFVMVALMILLTTVTRIVNNQRTQIGTLKALGFNNRSLMLHYLSYGFILTTIGSILGIIIGYNTIPYIFVKPMQAYYTLPTWHAGFNINFIYVGILMIIGSMLCSYYAVKNIISESPASTLRAKPPKVHKLGFIENNRIWNKLGFNLRWNIRDVNRNRLRSIISLLGVIGCTVLLISAFGMHDGVNDLKEWKYNDINHYQTQLLLQGNITPEQTNSLIDKYNATPVMTQSIQIQVDDEVRMETLSVYDESPLITPTDVDRDPMKLPKDGVAVSAKTADDLAIDEGDTIRWHLYGNETWIESKVGTIYGDPSVQGITLSTEAAAKNNIDFKPTQIVTKQKVTEKVDGVRSVNSYEDLTSSWDKLSQTANLLIILLVIFAILLAITVLYSLGLLGFTEVERDMATLKVIGFGLNELRKIFVTQYLGISLIGFIIGLPTGYIILEIVRDQTDTFYYPINFSPTTILVSFIITILVSVVVNILLAQKLKTIDMVEALKKERD